MRARSAMLGIIIQDSRARRRCKEKGGGEGTRSESESLRASCCSFS